MSMKASLPSGGDAAPQVREEAAELDETLQGLKEKYRPGDFTASADEPGGIHGNEFPAKLTKFDPHDERIALKKQLITSTGNKNGSTPLGMATITEADYKWMERQKQARQYYNLTRFIDNYFNMKDPINVRFVQEIYPEYFERRKAVIDEQAELEHRVALMRLYGPKSKEDLVTLYAIDSGAVKLPQSPLFQPESWWGRKRGAYDYVQGLFNPKKIFTSGLTNADQRHDILDATGRGFYPAGGIAGIKDDTTFATYRGTDLAGL